MRASANATAVTESSTPHDPGSGLLRTVGYTRGRVLRVAVAHGSPAVRAALRACLDDQTGITVIGEAASADEAVHVAAWLHPDVVVIDVGLPGPGCVAATRRARAVSGAAVLVLCGDEPDPRVLAALRAGAAAVMRTDSAPSDLIRALTLLGRGRPLRPRRCGRGRHSSEVTMQLPKVIEIRRGSAHGRTVAPLAAAAGPSARLVGGLRWNSGT